MAADVIEQRIRVVVDGLDQIKKMSQHMAQFRKDMTSFSVQGAKGFTNMLKSATSFVNVQKSIGKATKENIKYLREQMSATQRQMEKLANPNVRMTDKGRRAYGGLLEQHAAAASAIREHKAGVWAQRKRDFGIGAGPYGGFIPRLTGGAAGIIGGTVGKIAGAGFNQMNQIGSRGRIGNIMGIAAIGGGVTALANGFGGGNGNLADSIFGKGMGAINPIAKGFNSIIGGLGSAAKLALGVVLTGGTIKAAVWAFRGIKALLGLGGAAAGAGAAAAGTAARGAIVSGYGANATVVGGTAQAAGAAARGGGGGMLMGGAGLVLGGAGLAAKAIGPLAGIAGNLAGGFMRVASGIGLQAAQGYFGMIFGALSRAAGKFEQFGTASAPLMGTGLGKKGLSRGIRLGYDPIQMAQMRLGAGRATGAPSELLFAGLGRASGVDPSALMSMGGVLRGAGGLGFSGGKMGTQLNSSGGRAMVKLLADGMSTGIEESRIGEYLESMAKLMGDMASVRGRPIGGSDIKQMSALLSTVTGFTGLAPGAAADMIGGVQQGIRSPGGGEAGKNLMLQALGFGTTGAGFFEATRRQQRAGPEEISDVVKYFQNQFGARGQDVASYAMSQGMPGLSMDKLDELAALSAAGKLSAEYLKQVMDEIPSQQKTLEKINEEMKSGGIVRAIAGMSAELIGIGAKTWTPMHDLQKEILKEAKTWIPQFKDIMEALKNFLADPLQSVKLMRVDIMELGHKILATAGLGSYSEADKEFYKQSRKEITDATKYKSELRERFGSDATGRAITAEYMNQFEKGSDFRLSTAARIGQLKGSQVPGVKWNELAEDLSETGVVSKSNVIKFLAETTAANSVEIAKNTEALRLSSENAKLLNRNGPNPAFVAPDITYTFKEKTRGAIKK